MEKKQMTIETVLLNDGVLRVKKLDNRGRVLITLEFENDGLRAYGPYGKRAPLRSYENVRRRLNPKSTPKIPSVKAPLLLTHDKRRRDED